MCEFIIINGKKIGCGNETFIIAEAGVNHNGSIDLAKRLVDVAKEANVNAIKFQSFIAEEEVIKTINKVEYQKNRANDKESYYDFIKKLELNKQKQRELMIYCKKKNIIFLSTPSEEKSAELLEELDVPAFKIGSNDIITISMLRKIAKYNKPIILSRGMATEDEINEAITAINSEGNEQIAILHCTSNYPTKIEDSNLKAILTLRKKFNNVIGYSDHTLGVKVPVIAVLLGAAIIEKHFTLDKSLSGPDHSFSLNPEELREMVRLIREVDNLSEKEKEERLLRVHDLSKILGRGELIPSASELDMRKHTRKSIFAKINLEPGTIITLDNICFKRPGDGIPANRYIEVLGRKVSKKIAKDKMLSFVVLQ